MKIQKICMIQTKNHVSVNKKYNHIIYMKNLKQIIRIIRIIKSSSLRIICLISLCALRSRGSSLVIRLV